MAGVNPWAQANSPRAAVLQTFKIIRYNQLIMCFYKTWYRDSMDHPNHTNLRDDVFHSAQKGRPLQGILDKCSKITELHVAITGKLNDKKNDNAGKYSLGYLSFYFQSKEMVPLFCYRSRGR